MDKKKLIIHLALHGEDSKLIVVCKKILKVNHGILIYFNTCSLLTLLFLSFLQFITPFDAPKEFFQGEKLQLSVIKAGRTQLNSETNQCDYRFE